MGYVARSAVACQRPPRRYGLSSLPSAPPTGALAATAAQSVPLAHRSTNLQKEVFEGLRKILNPAGTSQSERADMVRAYMSAEARGTAILKGGPTILWTLALWTKFGHPEN